MIKKGWDRKVYCPHCWKYFDYDFIQNAKTDPVYLKVCNNISSESWMSYCMFCGGELKPYFDDEFKDFRKNDDLYECEAIRRNKEIQIESFKTGKSIQQVKNDFSEKELETQRLIVLAENTNNKPNNILCPNCSSHLVKKITTTSRLVGAFALGVFNSNMGKTYKCKKCGYKW